MSPKRDDCELEQEDYLKPTVMEGELLDTDLLSEILSYLPWVDILPCRLVARAWRETVTHTAIWEPFLVQSGRSSLTEHLPNVAAVLHNLKAITLSYYPVFDPSIQEFTISEATIRMIVHHCPNVQSFCQYFLGPGAPQYLRLFPSTLQELRLGCSNYDNDDHVQLSVHDLAGVYPHLRILKVDYLKESFQCNLVELVQHFPCLELLSAKHTELTGSLEDVAYHPRLQVIDLENTLVEGDVRQMFVGKNKDGDDWSRRYPWLHYLGLSPYMYPCSSKLKCIRDTSQVMEDLYTLGQKVGEQPHTKFADRRPILRFAGTIALDPSSPDYYHDNGNPPSDNSDNNCSDHHENPRTNRLLLSAVVARMFWADGQRCGWRWETREGSHPCSTHWLDPPNKGNRTNIDHNRKCYYFRYANYGQDTKQLYIENYYSANKAWEAPPSLQ